MIIGTQRTQRTEPTLVVRTRGAFCVRLQVWIETHGAIFAVLRLGVVDAFGHLADVVLVEELTSLSALAQPLEPVLAREAIVEMTREQAKWYVSDLGFSLRLRRAAFIGRNSVAMQ